MFCTHHGLIFISGMGAHVKKTVSSKKDLRPHTSDNAPISGALRNDNRPWKGWGERVGGRTWHRKIGGCIRKVL